MSEPPSGVETGREKTNRTPAFRLEIDLQSFPGKLYPPRNGGNVMTIGRLWALYQKYLADGN